MPTILPHRQLRAESSQPIRKTHVQTALLRVVQDEYHGAADSERVLTPRRPSASNGHTEELSSVFRPMTSPIGRPRLVPLCHARKP
jgi:hypothetical protein